MTWDAAVSSFENGKPRTPAFLESDLRSALTPGRDGKIDARRLRRTLEGLVDSRTGATNNPVFSHLLTSLIQSLDGLLVSRVASSHAFPAVLLHGAPGSSAVGTDAFGGGAGDVGEVGAEAEDGAVRGVAESDRAGCGGGDE